MARAVGDTIPSVRSGCSIRSERATMPLVRPVIATTEAGSTVKVSEPVSRLTIEA